MGADTLYLMLYGTAIRHRVGLMAPYMLMPGRADLPVDYAGPQGQSAGLDQVNAQLPANLKNAGPVSVTLVVDNAYSNTVTLLFLE
jgi:uncharacterized protein (TIGR03437 family)